VVWRSFEVKEEQEFDFNFPNIDTTSPVKLKLTAASAAFTTSMNVAANGNAVGTISFPSLNQILKQHFMSDRSPTIQVLTVPI
jgi:hypothetical protein